MSTWLLVSGDFTSYGGMDVANFALASYLARAPDTVNDAVNHTANDAGNDVHLVSHQIAPELVALPRITPHIVPRPFGLHRLGEPLLRAAAARVRGRLADRGTRAVANGGNADLRDMNWVHYVHSAFTPVAAGLLNRVRAGRKHDRYVNEERTALRHARIVICNSNRTADDVVRHVGVERDRTRVIYYGTDPRRFRLVTPEEREASRRALDLPLSRRMALFVGALGDRRKGFDTVFESWRTLCTDLAWDVDLVVAGTGAELETWKARADRDLPAGRMRFLGFRRDMPTVFAACDLLIHPARYEAYGLAVHEALCRGLPAIVSAHAGVAERYPADLDALLLHDPASATELSTRLTAWRNDSDVSDRVADFAARLRSRTWDHMARDIASLAHES